MSEPAPRIQPSDSHQVGSDIPFLTCFIALGAAYVLLIIGMIWADLKFTTWNDLVETLQKPEIRFSFTLSIVSCTVSALLSLLVAIPIGYLLSRWVPRDNAGNFCKNVIDAVLDIPIVLPPLVIGISLLILFNKTLIGQWIETAFMWVVNFLRINVALGWINVKPVRGITYDLPAVVLSQFAVACAFAVRTMRVAFDQIDTRREQVALTLGCSRGQAFFRVVLPQAGPGAVTAGTLAWARSIGEFGPILIFAGATRMKTEVLPTSVFLEMSVGDLEAAVAVSLIMVTAAVFVLILARMFGIRRGPL